MIDSIYTLISEEVWCICNALEGDEVNQYLVQQGKYIAQASNRKLVVICYGTTGTKDNYSVADAIADYVVQIDCDSRKKYDVSNGLDSLIRQSKPYLVLFPSNYHGRYFASTLATRLNLGLVAECVELKYDRENDRILFFRTAIDSSAMVSIVCTANIQMCTMKSIKLTEVQYTKVETHYIYYKFTENDQFFSLVKVSEKRFFTQNETSLKDTKVIIGVGKGAINCLEQVYQLASLINASIGCTRGVVESGIFTVDHQIGQSGKSVSPDLYIAFGISGASQHMIGLKNAKTIIAVNKNKDARIFEYSDYAIVEDSSKVTEQLIKKVKGEKHG